MFKVMTILGTRPEIIKMSRIINLFDKNVNHVLVHTGQSYDYELNEIFFDELKIRKPDYFLEAVSSSAIKTIAKIIENVDDVLIKEKPDAVLLYGDTNSSLSVIAAKRHKIPIFHLEAGNRCFDQRVPEELNRRLVDHMSDINFVLTEHARRYLIAEGLKHEQIFKTGSHMHEVLNYYLPEIIRSDILSRIGVKKRKYFLISIHREENVDYKNKLTEIIDTLNELAEQYNFPIIVSFHPRTKNKLDTFDLRKLNSNIKFHKPFGFFDYIKLQMEAFCIISDSGTITEETSLLNLRAITLRESHERPEGMDEGTLIMTGLKKDRVIDAVKVIDSQYNEKTAFKVKDYEKEDVSKHVLRVVMSYIDYVNVNTWKKI